MNEEYGEKKNNLMMGKFGSLNQITKVDAGE